MPTTPEQVFQKNFTGNKNQSPSNLRVLTEVNFQFNLSLLQGFWSQ